jgi:hypothetical protein
MTKGGHRYDRGNGYNEEGTMDTLIPRKYRFYKNDYARVGMTKGWVDTRLLGYDVKWGVIPL